MLRFPVIIAITAVLVASVTADQLDGFFHVPSVSLRSSYDANSSPSCPLSDGPDATGTETVPHRQMGPKPSKPVSTRESC